MLYTTLRLLNEHQASIGGLKHLIDSVPEGFGQDRPIYIVSILDINGLEDAIRSLRATPKEQAHERDKLARLMAVGCAEYMLHDFEQEHPNDMRPRMAIEMSCLFAFDMASKDELYDAEGDAWYAALDIQIVDPASDPDDPVKDHYWDAAGRAAAYAAQSAAGDAAAAVDWIADWTGHPGWQSTLLRKLLTCYPQLATPVDNSQGLVGDAWRDGLEHAE